jgi:sugar/nucleoside kinase (ribokinase family)
MRIVGIGNPVFDYIKTPLVDTEIRILSGCSTNACLAASKLGAETALVGRIGDDFRDQFDAGLKKHKIQGSVYPSKETGGFSLIYYDTIGNRSLDVLGRAEPISEVSPPVLADTDFVIVGPILGEVSLDVLRDVKANCGGLLLLDPQGMLRVIDSGGRIDHVRNPDIDAMIALCDVVKANEVEAEIITGIHPRTSEDALRESTIRLHALGCKIAIVTLAAEGSAAYDGITYWRIPAYATNAVDPTGAGDTYAAGFMVGYLLFNDIKEACFYGSCVASVMVENVGPDFPLTRAEADRRFAELIAKG